MSIEILKDDYLQKVNFRVKNKVSAGYETTRSLAHFLKGQVLKVLKGLITLKLFFKRLQCCLTIVADDYGWRFKA